MASSWFSKHSRLVLVFGFILLAIFPRSIGDTNPINGFVHKCYGLEFKIPMPRPAKVYGEYPYYNYFCLGVPYEND